MTHELVHEFTDRQGNTLLYMRIQHQENGEGVVHLQFAKSGNEEAMASCRNLAKMLKIELVELDDRNVQFKTGDEITTALILTRDLENNHIVGEGALASFEDKLKEKGWMPGADPMESALKAAKQYGVRNLDEVALDIYSEQKESVKSTQQRKPSMVRD